jgi:hypothetical protein
MWNKGSLQCNKPALLCNKGGLQRASRCPCLPSARRETDTQREREREREREVPEGSLLVCFPQLTCSLLACRCASLALPAGESGVLWGGGEREGETLLEVAGLLRCRNQDPLIWQWKECGGKREVSGVLGGGGERESGGRQERERIARVPHAQLRDDGGERRKEGLREEGWGILYTAVTGQVEGEVGGERGREMSVECGGVWRAYLNRQLQTQMLGFKSSKRRGP